MQQISELTSTATSAGEFTNGSVASGVSPTILDAGWFNTIQRELIAVVEGGGLTLDPTNDAQVLTALKALLLKQNAGRLINVQRFSASGTYTPTAGTKTFIVQMVGAGASGGSGVTATSSVYSASGGGGGGGAFLKFMVDIAASGFTTAVITVGKGGSAVTGAAGIAGGNTYFGSDIYATGGNGGQIGTRATDTYYNNNCYMVIPGIGGSYVYQGKTGYTLLMAKKGGIGGWGMLGGPGQLGGSGGDSFYSGNVGVIGNSASGIAPSVYEYGGGGSGSCTLYDLTSPLVGAYTAKASGAGVGGYVEIYEFS